MIIGAGVIGSFNAARLKQAGHDVTLLARGQRLVDLREHGVMLEDLRSGRGTTTRVPLVDRIGPNDAYDLAIVATRRNQIRSILPALAQNHGVPSVLFLGNNAAGTEDIVEALGRERVLIGMANAGGEHYGPMVLYLWWRRVPLWFGELDGARTPRQGDCVPIPKCWSSRPRREKRGCLPEDTRGGPAGFGGGSPHGGRQRPPVGAYARSDEVVHTCLARGAPRDAGCGRSLEIPQKAARLSEPCATTLGSVSGSAL